VLEVASNPETLVKVNQNRKHQISEGKYLETCTYISVRTSEHPELLKKYRLVTIRDVSSSVQQQDFRLLLEKSRDSHIEESVNIETGGNITADFLLVTFPPKCIQNLSHTVNPSFSPSDVLNLRQRVCQK
jgi:hypothetical protein